MPHRRALLAGITTAIAVTSAVRADVADAEAVRLAERMEACNTERERISVPSYIVEDYEFSAAERARLDTLNDVYFEARERLGAIRTRSLEGLRAKARALVVELDLDNAQPPGSDHEHYLVWSLCHDLLG